MKAIKLMKFVFCIAFFATVTQSCDKSGVNEFELRVINPTLNNVTVIIEDFTGYIPPNRDENFKIKLDGYDGDLYDFRAVINTSGSLDNLKEIDDFMFEDGFSYQYTVGQSTIKETSDNGAEDEIVGTWMLSSGCVNLNSEANYYEFLADGSGYFFAADCESMCANYGVYFYFDYEKTAASITLNNTSVSTYCGVSSETPAAESVSYSLSGDVLTIGSNTYIRQ